MPFLMHIAFDNPFRLKRNVHYFEYCGVRFKLIQNDPRKWSDVLITIVDSAYSAAAQQAYSVAGEFASALSWELGVGTAIRGVGGPGVREGFTLRRARCTTRVFPEIPFQGMMTGFNISRIAKVASQEQRIGLTLFREARGANKVLLSLLLYWQVMEIRHGHAEGWIDKTVRKHPQVLVHASEDVKRLPLQGKSLGHYLLDDCRHAIAHIRRKPGKRVLKFDDFDESGRLWSSSRVAQELARFYIETELGVTERLYLVRPRRGGFPRYIDEAAIQKGSYKSVR
jgi:hypothetical protein